MNAKVSAFIDQLPIWKDETQILREILLDCGLQEEWKWAKPAYTFKEKNVIVIQPFKKYLAVLFPNGYLIDDGKNTLVKTGPNTIKGRQIRFEDVADIRKKEKPLRHYAKLAKQIITD